MSVHKLTELCDNFVEIITCIEAGDYCYSQKIEMLKMYETQTSNRITQLLTLSDGFLPWDRLIDALKIGSNVQSLKYRKCFLNLVEKVSKSLEDVHESRDRLSGCPDDEVYEQFLEQKKKFENLERENDLFREELESKSNKIVQIELLKSKVTVENVRLRSRISLLNEDLREVSQVIEGMNNQIEESKGLILTLEKDLLSKNQQLEIKSKELVNLQEEYNELRSKLTSSLEFDKSCNCDKWKDEFLPKNDVDCFLMEDRGSFSDSSRIIVSSTRKSLDSDLSEAWKIFSLPALEDFVSSSELENESNIFDKVVTDDQEDSGLEMSELSSRLSDMTDINLPSAKFLQNESTRSFQKSSSSRSLVGNDVQSELEREQLRSQLEEVGKEIDELEVSSWIISNVYH